MMFKYKNFLAKLAFLGLAVCMAPSVEAQYNISIQIDDYKNDTLILGYRRGKQTFAKDTAFRTAPNQPFVFKSDTATLDGGVYLALLLPTSNYFEFLVTDKNRISNEQKNLKIHTKLGADGDLTRDLKINNSSDNQVFLDYLQYLNKMRNKSIEINERKEKAKTAGDAKLEATLVAELESLNDSVSTKQKEIFSKYPDFLSSKLIKASVDPIISKEIQDKGQEAAYREYKARYFENLDFGDHRLILTPVLENKLEYYLDKLVIQHPDSVAVDCDLIMDKVIKGGDKEMYKYVASFLLNKYAQSQVICMDAVYVHLGQKYYCNAKNKPDWVEAEQLEKICDNVEELKHLRCGQPALEISAKNIKDGSNFKLSSLMGKKRYTLLFFWDPACGNCGKAAERLSPIYQRYKDFGLEVVGICSKDWKDVEDCRKKATEKNMTWINLSDEAYPLAVIKKQYAIKMNPYIYLYDKDMKLMFKRLDPEQVDDIIHRELQAILDDPNSKEIKPEMRPALEKTLQLAKEEKAKRLEKDAAEKAKEDKAKEANKSN